MQPVWAMGAFLRVSTCLALSTACVGTADLNTARPSDEDAGTADAGPLDGGPSDAGAADAGVAGAAIDGGAPADGGQPTAMKWHPGHYILAPIRPTLPGYVSAINSLMAEMASVVDAATGKPAFDGYLGSYTWYWLETREGVYDTTLIDQDLATLKVLSQRYGKHFRLIIQLAFDSYGAVPHTIPSTPQVAPYSAASSTYPGILPDYIINGVSGLGQDAFLQVQGLGLTAAWWRPAVMARYVALVRYLGEKYDSNPDVEMILPMDQTSDGAANPPPDLTAAFVKAAWEELISATAASWPTTNKILTNNFYGTGSNVPDLLAISQFAAANGLGMGGPDLSDPPRLAWSEGELIIQGAGKSSLDGFETADFGTTDYRGRIPIAFQQQQGGYVSGVTASQFEAFGWSEVETTHMIWENDSANPNATMTWAEVVAALQSQHFRIHSACPTRYGVGCRATP